MTQKGLIKHWDVIEKFKNGAKIKYLSWDGFWRETDTPSFSENTEYKAIEFKPKQGQKILVSKNGNDWVIRVFVKKTEHGYYQCLEGSPTELIYRKKGTACIKTVTWMFAKKYE